MTELLTIATAAAKAAGSEILKHYENFKIELKADNSPVTTADLAANDAIFGILERSQIPICSEENLLNENDRLNLKRFWLVDPLDGTKDFIAKTGQFCTCIALIEGGRPILSAIYAPVFGDLYYADESGSYKNGNLIEPKNPAPNVALVGFHNNPSAAKDAVFAHFGVEMKKIASAIKYCAIAQNQAFLNLGSNKMSLWDVAAGDLILRQSGGILLNLLTREPPMYNTKELKMPPTLALNRENAHLADEICEIWSKNRQI